MHIKLYHYPQTRSVRVYWLAHDMAPDVTIEIIRLDLYRGDQFRSAFRNRFPLHAVPAVEISQPDGTNMTMIESGAIVVALADALPRFGLAPASVPLSPARSDYLQVIHSCGASLDMMLWQIRIHRHIFNDDQRDERTIDRYTRKFVHEGMPAYLTRLERHPYVCGDHFTAADCMFGDVVRWARTYELCQEEPFTAYMKRLSERPAFQAAFADAHEFDPVPPREGVARGYFLG